MNLIRHTSFEGERPCFAIQDSRLEHVTFYPGESSIKHSRHVEAFQCEFMGKYPFWHNENVLIDDCRFTADARAAIWYSNGVRMRNTLVEAPKMFRRATGLFLENVRLPNAAECGWHCRDVELRDVEIRGGDYLLMNARDIRIENLDLQGNYAFDGARDILIRNARMDSRDAFWNTENVTVYDSVLDGEYLGWHSKNLRLVNCTVRGPQPLCYATDLVMENCVMEDTDLCFEYSTLDAEIASGILSVRNPKGGRIRAQHIDEIILDAHCQAPGACEIRVADASIAA